MSLSGNVTEKLLHTEWWTDEAVAKTGLPVIDTALATVGGGIGSFVLFDLLRIAGVPESGITVLSPNAAPWQNYEYLTRVSQIPKHERLRSDSSGMPDNIWAFPSYAVLEAWRDRRLGPLFQVLVEPVFAGYYTPRAEFVFKGMAREAERIGYSSRVVRGHVHHIRRRHGGGYFAVLGTRGGTPSRIVYRARHVHLGVGYPGLRFLPDLQAYRQATGDRSHVVNAYEPHDHVYEELRRHGGTVMVRGSGIAASRILQRLMEDRWDFGAQTRIVHLFRTYVSGPRGDSLFSRRPGGDGWAYQGFNWPKSAWGGQLKEAFERLEGEERAELYRRLGGSHTPRRRLWRQQLRQARAEGWYETMHGQVEQVARDGRGLSATVILATSDRVSLAADFIIDATGLEGDLRDHRLMADLLDHCGAATNPLGRLDVERTFETRGTRSDPGRMYASGSMTLGGYYAGVDTFLGLQYSALRIVDDLAEQGFCQRIGVTRSVAQWLRWIIGRTP